MTRDTEHTANEHLLQSIKVPLDKLKKPAGKNLTLEDVYLPPSDLDLVLKIVQRGFDLTEKVDIRSNLKPERVRITPVYAQAVITMCHKWEQPLNLWQFLLAGDADFAHDFVGLYQFFDFPNLRLTGGFKPRFVKG